MAELSSARLDVAARLLRAGEAWLYADAAAGVAAELVASAGHSSADAAAIVRHALGLCGREQDRLLSATITYQLRA